MHRRPPRDLHRRGSGGDLDECHQSRHRHQGRRRWRRCARRAVVMRGRGQVKRDHREVHQCDDHPGPLGAVAPEFARAVQARRDHRRPAVRPRSGSTRGRASLRENRPNPPPALHTPVFPNVGCRSHTDRDSPRRRFSSLRGVQAENLDRFGAHLDLADLAGDRHRELVDDVDVARDLVVGQLSAWRNRERPARPTGFAPASSGPRRRSPRRTCHRVRR